MSEEAIGCAKPTGVAIGQKPVVQDQPEKGNSGGLSNMITARVGGKAPDFEAPAYKNGKFINVKLSDYLGKWVLICFYPGDFTFV